MRRFYLESQTGERFSLQHGNVFLHLPDGLGSTDDISYFEVGYGFYSGTNRAYVQRSISGVLVMSGDPYKVYQDFVDWIHRAGELKFVYMPTEQRELLMDVDVIDLQRSELTMFSVLEVPISITGKSPYYLRSNQQYVFTSDQLDSIKRYTYRYDYVYSPSGDADTVEIEAGGHFPAALEFRAMGPISNPVLTAKDKATDAVIGKLDLTGISVGRGETLYWSSRPNMTVIEKRTAAGVQSLIDYLNISNDNFFTLPTNTPALVSFTASIDPSYTDELTHVLTLHEYYRG